MNHGLDEAIYRVMKVNELLHHILIEKIEIDFKKSSGARGNHPDILRLTKDGELVFKYFSGKE